MAIPNPAKTTAVNEFCEVASGTNAITEPRQARAVIARFETLGAFNQRNDGQVLDSEQKESGDRSGDQDNRHQPVELAHGF